MILELLLNLIKFWFEGVSTSIKLINWKLSCGYKVFAIDSLFKIFIRMTKVFFFLFWIHSSVCESQIESSAKMLQFHHEAGRISFSVNLHLSVVEMFVLLDILQLFFKNTVLLNECHCSPMFPIQVLLSNNNFKYEIMTTDSDFAITL